MKAVFVKLQDQLNMSVTDASLRVDVLTTAMALAHSRVTSLPSAPVSSPQAYYNQQVLPLVDECLTKMNEMLCFDLKCARNETRQFWMLRYGTAHPAFLSLKNSTAHGFVDKICNAGVYLDQDLVCFGNENCDAILGLTDMITAMLEGEKSKDQDREVA